MLDKDEEHGRELSSRNNELERLHGVLITKQKTIEEQNEQQRYVRAQFEEKLEAVESQSVEEVRGMRGNENWYVKILGGRGVYSLCDKNN